ncbi:molybdopterin molybdotransferase MoeA [Enterococcus wangshanyuanii]|uniref:Molybdopterin molybdenumtransferase n=1 Tax=Enterococcus wangshanyuanii TaxID=2005703 RepID=A0ABQ1NQI2_9ENTE|nr:molybdopterin molybdotransferase MoeA [Enterococcus wangshanyuanii]GGC77555.1 molybdopterin molybdenumtransferase MoeA [Enterococcus wangshanyuanii]
MIEVEAAQEKIRQAFPRQNNSESVSILEATGRVCAEDIYARVAVPTFSRAGMDGYAVIAAETVGASEEQPVCLAVVGTIYAGDQEIQTTEKKGVAYKIMTGAPIPTGFDAVIRQEWTDYGIEKVELYREVNKGLNYGGIGEDVFEGQKIISKGQLINSRTIGILAAQGMETVSVFQPLKVGLIVTGTELVSIGVPLTSGKIYDSNLYTLASFIQSGNSQLLFKERCPDDIKQLSERIKEKISSVDVLITTGGVSVGEKDYLPEVIDKIGGQQLFHCVNMKPGTPVMASCYADCLILSLSGNLFASVVNLHLFYWSFLAHAMDCAELNIQTRKVRLASDLKYSGIRRFIRAYEKDGVVSLISDQHFSSVFHNTLETNCLIDQPAKTSLKQGENVTVYYWKL